MLKLVLCDTSNSCLRWMATLCGWWDLVHALNHTAHKVSPVQGMGEEGGCDGISSALGISTPSVLAKKKGEDVLERAEGEEAEVAGPEHGEAASLPISSS